MPPKRQADGAASHCPPSAKKSRKVWKTPAEKKRAESNRTNPRKSLTPLYTVRKDGSKQYGPKPFQKRLHKWQKHVTQTQWKELNTLSPHCRACNGNNSQGHLGDAACVRGREYIKKLKKLIKDKKKPTLVPAAPAALPSVAQVCVADKSDSDDGSDLSCDSGNDSVNDSFSDSDDDSAYDDDDDSGGTSNDATNVCVSFEKDITSYVEKNEVQKVLKRVVKSFGSGAVVWLHDDCPDVTRGGLPKAVAKPVKDYFVSHHAERNQSRKDLCAANGKVKELETELKKEREKNQAECKRLEEEHKKKEAEQKDLLSRTTAELNLAKDMANTYVKANEVLEANVAELRAKLKEADKVAAESIKAQAIKADELKKLHVEERKNMQNIFFVHAKRKIKEAYELGTKRGAQAFLQASAAALNLSLVPQQQPSGNSAGNA